MKQYINQTGNDVKSKYNPDGQTPKTITVGKPFQLPEEDNTTTDESSKSVCTGEDDNKQFSFKPVISDSASFMEDIDEVSDFQPLSLANKIAAEEADNTDLYDELLKSIKSIDSKKDVNEVFVRFDNLLKRMSCYDSSILSNSQLLILVSNMIVKLEEFNKENYPELSLNSAMRKLKNEGKAAVMSGNIKKFFFEDFFNYYQDIELEQFSKYKTKYSEKVNQFSEFQQQKSRMLMVLLKWLLD